MRGSLEITPDASFFARLTVDYTRDKSNSRGGHRLIPGLVSGAPVLADVFDTRAGLRDPKQDVKSHGFSGFVEYSPAEGVTLRSITAYRKDDSATPIDFDALPAVDLDVPAFYNNKQFSQEAQGPGQLGRLQRADRLLLSRRQGAHRVRRAAARRRDGADLWRRRHQDERAVHRPDL